MNDGKKLMKNYFVQIIGRGAGVFIGIITLAFLTRGLGESGFGELTTAMTYLQIFGIIVDFGLTLTLLQMISKPGADEKRIIQNILGLRLFSGIVFFGLAATLGFLLPYSLTIKLAIAIGTFSYLFMAVGTMLVGYYQKHLLMGLVAASELANRCLTLLVIIIFSYLNFGPVAMMGAFVIGNAVYLLLLLIFMRSKTIVIPKWEMHIWKAAIKESWPIGISIIFNLIYLKSDILILGIYFPQSVVGFYGAAYKVVDVLTALPVIYMGLILPGLVASYAQNKIDDFRRVIQQTFNFFSMISLPMLLGALALGVPIMTFVSGSSYAVSGEVLKILMIAIVILFFGSIFGHAIVALGLQKPMIWGYAITAIVSLAGYMLVIPKYGMFGGAWMTVASEVLIACVTFGVVSIKSKFFPNLKIFFLCALAAFVMYLAIIFMPDFHVLAKTAVGAAVYFALMPMFGIIKLNSIKAFFARS